MVGSELATQRAWESSPTTMRLAGHSGEPPGSLDSNHKFGEVHPAVAERRRRCRHLREFLRDLVAPFGELAGLSGNVMSSAIFPFTDVLNLWGRVVPGAFASALIPSILFKYWPVADFFTDATYSGVPCATSSPPRSPANGPRSISQSEFLIMSRWCSIRITVLPASTRR